MACLSRNALGEAKGRAGDPLDLATDGLAGQSPKLFVKRRIEIDIAIKIHVGDIALKRLVDAIEQARQLAHPRRGDATLGRQAERQPFQRTAQFDGVDHFLA